MAEHPLTLDHIRQLMLAADPDDQSCLEWGCDICDKLYDGGPGLSINTATYFQINVNLETQDVDVMCYCMKHEPKIEVPNETQN